MRTYNTIRTYLFCMLTGITFAQNKIIDTEKSTMNWTGKAAFSTYSLSGTLHLKSGEIKIENDSIISLNIEIDMRSLDHDNKDLKKHLRGKDFFEVKKHNNATFILTKAASINNGLAVITGEVTIKNITKVETFTIKLDKEYSNLIFDISINRITYGVTFNSPSLFKKMKENAIEDQFKLKGKLALIN